VHRLPDAAARRTDVDGKPRALVHRRERRDAPAPRRRADVARAEPRDRFGIDLDGGGLCLREQEREEEDHGRTPGRANLTSSSGTLASILSYVIFERSVLLLPFGPD